MIPSALFIAARSAARAAADIRAFTSGLILLRRSWMATASAADQRLAASLAHRSCVAAHLLVVRLALRVGTVDGHPWACVQEPSFVSWNRFRGDNMYVSPRGVTWPSGHYTSPHPNPRAAGVKGPREYLVKSVRRGRSDKIDRYLIRSEARDRTAMAQDCARSCSGRTRTRTKR